LMWIYRHTHIDCSLSLCFLISHVIFLRSPHLLNRDALFIIFSITIYIKKNIQKKHANCFILGVDVMLINLQVNSFEINLYMFKE
jgi:hypothetical protein